MQLRKLAVTKISLFTKFLCYENLELCSSVLLLMRFTQLASENESEMASGHSLVVENAPKAILENIKCKTFLEEHVPQILLNFMFTTYTILHTITS